MAGIAPQRRIPVFARQTFRDSLKGRPDAAGPPVILWADTFNNYFHPGTATAAYQVLTQLGFGVRVPRRHLCCGRPLYEFGLLDRARAYLLEILEVLNQEIDDGVPVVVLEPACASVFRDELSNMLPHDERAKRLRSQTYLLSEFIEERAPSVKAALGRKAVVHGHCHHKSILGMDAEQKTLERVGLDCDVLDSGCCGMAGSFGFEKDKFDVSIAAANRVLVPAVKAAGEETLIVADGFSCREQIEQLTGRRALHLAEVLRQALVANKSR